jgi:hypothetical protein
MIRNLSLRAKAQRTRAAHLAAFLSGPIYYIEAACAGALDPCAEFT